MRDRRFRQDAVSEIENVRRTTESLSDSPDAIFERAAAGNERQRIEITL